MPLALGFPCRIVNGVFCNSDKYRPGSKVLNRRGLIINKADAIPSSLRSPGQGFTEIPNVSLRAARRSCCPRGS
jgi:hypothetical protein